MQLAQFTKGHGMKLSIILVELFLTHFSPVPHFYTPRKCQKTFGQSQQFSEYVNFQKWVTNFHKLVATVLNHVTQCGKVSNVCKSPLSRRQNEELEFPTKGKTADIIPVHKKEDSALVKNHRPISVLPTASNIRKLDAKKISALV